MPNSRMQKNKLLHEQLKEEEKNQKSLSKEYEEKILSIDTSINQNNNYKNKKDNLLDVKREKEKEKFDKEDKIESILNPYLEDDDFENDSKLFLEEENDASSTIKQESEKSAPKKELIEVVEKPSLKLEYTKEIFDSNKEISNQPLSFTDTLSVEELLRARIEEQEKIRENKKKQEKNPLNEKYTPEMMQKNILSHEGFDIRKEINFRREEEKDIVSIITLTILVSVVVIGLLIVTYLILF